MEKSKIKIVKPITETIQTGIKEYEVDGYISSNGKEFTGYRAFYDCKRYEADLKIKDIFTTRIDYNGFYYNWYYCKTKKDLDGIANYCEFKPNSLDYIKLPQWIAVEFHEENDYADWYSILTKDEIDENYKNFIDRINESESYEKHLNKSK